jgi:murein DD-endopeptidase MepM/ murein hydrolase activator NlpD
MLRRIGLCLVALAFLAGCQTARKAHELAPAVQEPTRSPHRGSTIPYDGAPPPVHVDLRRCEDADRYRTGPISAHGGEPIYILPFIHAPSGALLRVPVSDACLSSGFGYRAHASGGGRAHYGIDLANRMGGFVYAAGAGRIVWAGLRGAYGNAVEIDHGMDVRTLYGHLAEINPRFPVGSSVGGGAAIGLMGATGNATGVHLHYEVIVNEMRVDPLTYGAQPPVG